MDGDWNSREGREFSKNPTKGGTGINGNVDNSSGLISQVVSTIGKMKNMIFSRYLILDRVTGSKIMFGIRISWVAFFQTINKRSGAFIWDSRVRIVSVFCSFG